MKEDDRAVREANLVNLFAEDGDEILDAEWRYLPAEEQKKEEAYKPVQGLVDIIPRATFHNVQVANLPLLFAEEDE